ncbi:MAG: putative toxin-antitoxin system toxin component, PIN family [Actinobacteria bacterium]|nr:putative toxin-antitoxin system toxin component, PIN family [Actinomycetota bacterium]
MNRLRVVFDANVFIAAFLGRKKKGLGAARSCFELARLRKIHLICSPEIINEVARIMRDKFDWSEENVNDAVKIMRAAIREYVKGTTRITAISHESDNRILECALVANADLIISGDRHLLELKEYQRISIMRTADLLHIIGEKPAEDMP